MDHDNLTNPVIMAMCASRAGIAALVIASSLLAGAEPSTVTGAAVVSADHAWPADFRDDQGRIGVDSLLLEGRVFWRPHPAVRIGLGIGASRDDYTSDGVDPSADLPAHVQHLWLRLPISVMGSPHWGVSLQGSVGTGTDGMADARSGRQYQFQGGPVFVRDDNLILCLLLNVSSRINDRPSIFPFPSLYWRFHDDWRLTLVDEVDNVSRLTWQIHDLLAVGLRLDVRFREAALNGDAVLADDHAALACEASWRPFHQDVLVVTPFAGAVLARRLTLRSQDGSERWSAMVRPTPWAGLSLRAEF